MKNKIVVLLLLVLCSKLLAMEEQNKCLDADSRSQALRVLFQKMDSQDSDDAEEFVNKKVIEEWIKEIAIRFGLNELNLYASLSSSNYIELRGGLFKGSRDEYSIDQIVKAESLLKMQTEGKALNYIERKQRVTIEQAKLASTACYKIHIMPKDSSEYFKMIKKLIRALVKDKQLQKSVFCFKVQPRIDFSWSREEIEELLRAKSVEGEIMPIIVVYPSSGKEYAQYVLYRLYVLYKNLSGLGLVPRYSLKITKALSYAQGNGDEKAQFPQFYTEDKVFFSESFVNHEGDFALENPHKYE